MLIVHAKPFAALRLNSKNNYKRAFQTKKTCQVHFGQLNWQAVWCT
jgi:hypothetical protein